MDYLKSTVVALLIGVTGIWGGYLLFGKQVEWFQNKSMELLHKLVIAEQDFKKIQEKNHKLSTDIINNVKRNRETQASLNEEINSLVEILNKRTKELDKAQEIIGSIQEEITGVKGVLAEDRIKMLNELLASNKDFEDITELRSSVKSIKDSIATIRNNFNNERKISVAINLPDGTPWGRWTGAKYCPKNHYVCGMEQSVEGHKRDQDDTGVNSIRFYCCPLPILDL